MKRCVVVGGGVAGLAAALRLSSAGHTVTLCEAAPALGGRVRSFTDRVSGQEIDNGQHVLMGACTSALEYLAESAGGGGMGVGRNRNARAIDAAARFGLQRFRGLALPFVHADGRQGKLQAGVLPHPLSMAQAFLRYDLLTLRARLRILRVTSRLRSLRRRKLDSLDVHSASEWLRGCGQREEEIELFWRPIVLATMNTEPADASARLFVILLKEIFLGRADAADMLLPTTGLSRIFIDPAVQELTHRGVDIRGSTGVTSVDIRHFEGGTIVRGVRCGECHIEADRVILAVQPWALGRLGLTHEGALDSHHSAARLVDTMLPGVDLAEFCPSEILSVHVWTRRDLGRAPMTGLLGTSLQWVFFKGQTADGAFHYSCTISSARGDESTDASVLRATLLRELALLSDSFVDDDIIRILPIREKRATFVPKAGLEALRPHPRTQIAGLYLAGDWTATGLPATIEGAVRSGFRAAAALVDDEDG
jgi:hydroxysqualene dehydroxylase